MDYNLNRTQRIEVRVSAQELEILQRMAKKYEVSVSDYLRWMGLWVAVKNADRLALKMLGEKLSVEAREIRARFYEAVGLSGSRKAKRT